MVFRRSGFNRVVTLPLGAMVTGVDDPDKARCEETCLNGFKCCDSLRGLQSRMARLRRIHSNPKLSEVLAPRRWMT